MVLKPRIQSSLEKPQVVQHPLLVKRVLMKHPSLGWCRSWWVAVVWLGTGLWLSWELLLPDFISIPPGQGEGVTIEERMTMKQRCLLNSQTELAKYFELLRCSVPGQSSQQPLRIYLRVENYRVIRKLEFPSTLTSSLSFSKSEFKEPTPKIHFTHRATSYPAPSR